jgi:hypothetical protein
VIGLYFIGGPYIKAKGSLFMSFMLTYDSQTYMELLLRADISGRCSWDNCKGNIFEWDNGSTVSVIGLYFIGGPYIKAKGPLFMSFMLTDDSQTYMELLLRADISGRCSWDNCKGNIFEWDNGSIVSVIGLYFIGRPYIKTKGSLFMSFMLTYDSQTYVGL